MCVLEVKVKVKGRTRSRFGMKGRRQSKAKQGQDRQDRQDGQDGQGKHGEGEEWGLARRLGKRAGGELWWKWRRGIGPWEGAIPRVVGGRAKSASPAASGGPAGVGECWGVLGSVGECWGVGGERCWDLRGLPREVRTDTERLVYVPRSRGVVGTVSERRHEEE